MRTEPGDVRLHTESERARLWHGNALDLYGSLDEGAYQLVISDGPYGMGKDRAWDPGSVDALPDLYAPHVEAWGRLCAPAASVYLWGRADGWARLDPLMREVGWRFRGLVIWDKGIGSLAGKIDTEGCRTWPDVTEVCGFYQREPWDSTAMAGPATYVAHAAGADERNWIRDWLRAEWKAAGLTRGDAKAACGVTTTGGGIVGHYFDRVQWELPTWDRYQQLAAYAAEHGPTRERPYLVHPDAPGIRASYDHLRASYDHLRAEYEARQTPFTLPLGITNVWSHPIVAGSERLSAPQGGALHPCQKPLLFYRRMIRASTTPGARILEPFGGTCRAAVAAHQIREARHVDCMERDSRYLDAVRPALVFVPEEGGLPLTLAKRG